jgi:LDH2 family malate/lactate/ureidoglycolate dehydrogenase
MPTFSADALRTLILDIAIAVGTPGDLGEVLADSLVAANLAGHDSHGVLRMPPYCGSIDKGDILPGVRPQLISHKLSTARIDGGWGWGQPAMHMATDAAIERAREHGMGAAIVQNCYHIGRAAPYVEKVARAGMFGLIMANAGASVAPYGGRERVLGTNPVAWAMPRAEGTPPLSFDIATAGIAEGKLRVALSKDLEVAPGLLVTKEGQPTTDPNDFFAGGAILPFGGHKGNGFSILAQMLGVGLMGASGHRFRGPLGVNGPIIMVLDIEMFTDLETFTTEIEAQCARISQAAPAEGFERVLLPGELEQITEAQRSRDGIPIPESTWASITETANRFGVALPVPLTEAVSA